MGLDLLYFTAVNISPSLTFIHHRCIIIRFKFTYQNHFDNTYNYIKIYYSPGKKKKKLRKIPTEVYKPLK